MSYLKFDKNIMTNLSQSLPKEMLRTIDRELTIVRRLSIVILASSMGY